MNMSKGYSSYHVIYFQIQLVVKSFTSTYPEPLQKPLNTYVIVSFEQISILI